MKQQVEVYMGYDVYNDVTVLVGCVLMNGKLIDKVVMERDVVGQYEQAMRVFCIASKLLIEIGMRYDIHNLDVSYYGVDQYIGTWIKKGKKEYEAYINYIKGRHAMLIVDWQYIKLNGGREAVKNNIAKKVAVDINKGKMKMEKELNKSVSSVIKTKKVNEVIMIDISKFS